MSRSNSSSGESLYSSRIEELYELMHVCKKHYCEENVLFLLDIEKMNSLTDDKEIMNMCRRIYKKYFTKGEENPYELNVSQNLFDVVTKALTEKNLAQIKKALSEVETDIRRTLQLNIVPFMFN